LKKKKWVRPELVVIVRNQPEESVLETCKNYNPIGAGYVANLGCYYEVTPPFVYALCYDLVSS